MDVRGQMKFSSKTFRVGCNESPNICSVYFLSSHVNNLMRYVQKIADSPNLFLTCAIKTTVLGMLKRKSVERASL